ncbi:MAG TPA: hypothetical protein VJ022_08005 [Anaerolineales bacterium]|nr:hypothetical protein [Anaerolineales bacterium]
MSFQDIRKSRRFLSAEEIRLLVFILFGLAILFALNIFLAEILPGGEWLYLRWSGARAFLVEQVEPYSTTIAERVQKIVYGRNAFASEYSYVLNDPFHIVLLYTPLARFFSFPVARAVWMVFAEGALVASVLFAFRLADWQPPRWLYISLVGFGLFGYFNVISLISGSPAIFIAFLCICILLALRSFNDELAGGLLVFIAYQWEVSGLFFLFIVILVVANRRWGVLVGFGMSFFVLFVVSFLANQGWGLPYVRAVLSVWYKAGNLNFSHFLSSLFPNSTLPLGLIASALLGPLVLIEWIGSARAHFRRVVWTACLSLAVTPLLGFAIFPSNHVVLILPAIFILTLVWERWNRNRTLAASSVLVVMFFVPFGLYGLTFLNGGEVFKDLLTVLPPAAAVIGLYWMRWWAVRSRRTWFDQIGDIA